MKLEDLNSHPEYPKWDIVEQFCNLALDQAETVTVNETLGNLKYLGDKQWHTYEPASDALRDRIKNWLIQSGALDSTENHVAVLVISFCFSLDKEFYSTVLEKYVGAEKLQFAKDLENSHGDFIDPWWSLKKP